MTALDIPGDLILTVHPWLQPDYTATGKVTAQRVLEVPTTLTGIWDGPDVPVQYPEPPFIMLDINWHGHLAGCGYEDVCRMVARLAAHLAAADDKWPTAEAHVRGLPVVDFRFSFIIAPAPIPGQPGGALSEFTEKLAAELDAVDPEGATRLRQLLEPGGCRCECGGCCCDAPG